MHVTTGSYCKYYSTDGGVCVIGPEVYSVLSVTHIMMLILQEDSTLLHATLVWTASSAYTCTDTGTPISTRGPSTTVRVSLDHHAMLPLSLCPHALY